MASVPSVSNASYWQYKDDTSYVLKWIDQTARSCGWKRQPTKQTTPAPSPATTGVGNMTSDKGTGARASEPTNQMAATSGRLKGKDRKAAKQHAAAEAAAAIEKQKRDEDERGVVLSALEILEQANLISSRRPSSADRPPASVMHALRRAIKLRQTFSDWFETTRPDDHKSNLAHRYFVKVLEKIAELLLLQATATATTSSNEADAGEANTGTSKVAPKNIYESLLEQATQEEFEPVPARSTKSASRSTKAETTASRQKYHMEVKNSQENALMVFTLFTDLQDIKAEVKSLWERCFKDGADMVIATVLTAQALAFVQRSEERVMSVLGDSGCREDLAPQEGLPKGAWSYPGTYCRLLSTLCNPIDIQAILRFEDSSYSSGNEGGAISMNDLTFAFSARRLGYLTRHGNISYCDPLLQEFEHNPRILLNADIEKVIRRDENLYCTLVELAQLHYVSADPVPLEQYPGDRRLFQSASQDPLVGALHPVWTREELNLTSVFAAEITLDIKEICDAFPASRPSYDHLYDRSFTLLGLGKRGESELDSIVVPTEDSPLVRGAGDDGWLIKVKKILEKVTCMIPDKNIADQDDTDVFCTIALRGTDNTEYTVAVPWQEEFADVDSTEALEIYGGLDPKALSYSTEEYQRIRLFKFIYAPRGARGRYTENNYPLFITIRQAFMETLIESAGIEVMNVDKHGVGSMAHLYNASRQLGLGNLRWPAMDRIIELHRVALFAGDAPTTPAAMLKSFSHRYWGPKGRMPRKEKMRIMNRAITFMRPSAMTQAYNEHWDTEGRIPYWYTLESNALAAAAEKKTGKKRPAGATKPSFVENMPVMEEYLAAQLRDVRVDYMEVDRVGVHFYNALLEHARGVFGRQANRVVRPKARDGWSDIDFVSEAFEQEAQLHGAVAKCGGDPSKLPPQDCDYLQDSINCLARSLRANGIGAGPDEADGEAVNTPTSLTRFRIRGSDDLPDISRLVLVSHCRCCHRKHYF